MGIMRFPQHLQHRHMRIGHGSYPSTRSGIGSEFAPGLVERIGDCDLGLPHAHRNDLVADLDVVPGQGDDVLDLLAEIELGQLDAVVGEPVDELDRNRDGLLNY